VFPKAMETVITVLFLRMHLTKNALDFAGPTCACGDVRQLSIPE